MKCQTFRVTLPWKDNTICHVYDKTWIPVTILARMVGIHHSKALALCRNLSEPNLHCNKYSQFISFSNWHLAVQALCPDWDAELVVEGIEQIEACMNFTGFAAESDELIEVPKKRKYAPQEVTWFVSFMEKCERQAVEEFKKTEKYDIMCQEAVQERAESIVDHIYQRIKNEMRESMQERAKREIARESRQLQSFILPGTKNP